MGSCCKHTVDGVQNLNEKSGTGVAFTRFPSTGKNKQYGEYLMNAQGEDVVAGIRTPFPIGKHEKNTQPSLEEVNLAMYKEIKDIADKLEMHYKDVQDIEFTIEDGVVYIYESAKEQLKQVSKLQ